MKSLLNSCQENESEQLRFVKIRQLKMEMANIQTAKESFLENLSIANKTIEEMTRNISMCMQKRGVALKHRLRDIWKEKVSEWDRQLELCLQAEKNITNSVPGLSATFSTFDEGIGFIDSGDVKFEEDMTILTKIKNFGTVSSVCHRRRPVIGKGFTHPWGVCSDPTGRILVSDRVNNRIQVFNEFREFIFQFGESGSRPGEFRHPTGIAVDRKLRIVISDTGNHRIQVFTYKGEFLTAFGQKGIGVGEFRFPQDVAVNEHCDIAVSDTQNRRIQLFTPYGGFVTQFCFGTDVSPWRIAFCGDDLLVTDAQNDRLVTITTARTTDGGAGGYRFADGGVSKEGGGKLKSVCFKSGKSFTPAGKNSVLVV